MSKIRRSFTPEDRYSIVQEAIRDGHADTCRKYHLSPSLLRKWRLKYLTKGKEGLKDSYSRVDPQLRVLEEENERFYWTQKSLFSYTFLHPATVQKNLRMISRHDFSCPVKCSKTS